jgi:hypothetical protein
MATEVECWNGLVERRNRFECPSGLGKYSFRKNNKITHIVVHIM